MKHGSWGALILIGALGASGCRRDQATVVVGAEPAAAPAEATPDAGPVATTAPETRDAAPPASAPIDLLRAVRTDVAVSSAYRDSQAQAVSLVDGDLETAWNSKTGDLAGAWIEVRLPEDASVASIALTAGFTRRTTKSDLFTGNHRVSKVRVLRAGQELGVFPLDVESRELQTIPVEGAGGVYRIEVIEVVPGSKAQWREVCVSELKVMGRAPGASEGQRIPRLSVGALPTPRQEPGTADRAAVGKSLRALTPWIAREWGELNDAQGSRGRASALDDVEIEETASLGARRRQALSKVAELVELVDEVRADRLRLAALEQVGAKSGGWTFLGDDDQDLIEAGVGAVVDWLGDDDARCRWATTDARLRLGLMVDEVEHENFMCEMMPMDYPEDEPPPPREAIKRCRSVERFMPRVEDLRLDWQSSARSAAEKLRRLELPDLGGAVQAEWTALQAQIELARTSCGWVRTE